MSTEQHVITRHHVNMDVRAALVELAGEPVLADHPHIAADLANMVTPGDRVGIVSVGCRYSRECLEAIEKKLTWQGVEFATKRGRITTVNDVIFRLRVAATLRGLSGTYVVLINDYIMPDDSLSALVTICQTAGTNMLRYRTPTEAEIVGYLVNCIQCDSPDG